MKTKTIITLGCLVATLSVLAGDFGSIGVVIVDRKNDKEPLRTGVVYPGSPAERAGMKPNGFLIAVDGTNVVGMSFMQSMRAVRGSVGTFVTLEVADSKMSHTNKFTIERMRAVFSGAGSNMKVEYFDH